MAKILYLFLKDGVWEGKVIVPAEWVKASTAPSVPVSEAEDSVKYGFKWWLYPYGKDDARLAWAGAGFGGQRPIALPEHDLILVFTGWNILPGQPILTARAAIDRVLEAVIDR